MATKSIVIHVDEQEITLLLKSANKADGIRRAELMAHSREGVMEGKTESEKQVAFYQYPTAVCSVKEPESIRTMSFEDFLKIDEQDIETWIEEAYKLNPQWVKAWKMIAQMTEQDEKKVGTPSAGLSEPTLPAEPETSPSSRS